MVMRWLHLSDFHVGSKEYGKKKLFSQTLDNIRVDCENGRRPDVVFLTGDIAFSGQPHEYIEFNKCFLTSLREIVGTSCECFMVPGNHDVDRDADWSSRDSVVARAGQTLLEPTPQGAEARKRLSPRFAGYADFAKIVRLPGPDWLFTPAGAFLTTLDPEGHGVGIVGLNTAWLSYGDDDKEKLSPGKDILEDVLRRIKDCRLVIVLGHHPLSWWREDESRAVSVMLADAHAIYLHGHRHKGEARIESAAATTFVAIQAGAVFQAHDDERWRNGFQWGEVDWANETIRLSAKTWSPHHRRFVLDTEAFHEDRRSGDWWVFPLPSKGLGLPPKTPLMREGHHELRAPMGWLRIDSLFLKAREGRLTRDDLIAYFDGFIPNWTTVLSSAVPIRGVVRTIVERLRRAMDVPTRPHVLLLSGPGGEGKSTAFLQALVALVKQTNFVVCWRQDDSGQLLTAALEYFPMLDRPWLIAADDVDTVANDILNFVREVRRQNRTDIHFFVACRDTDWRAMFAGDGAWQDVAQFTTLSLRGLTQDDANAIVSAWADQGDDGMADLKGKNTTDAAKELLAASRKEAANPHEGALLGALIRARHGQDLNDHVGRLIRPLGNRPAPGGSLLTAYAYIALMHAENLLYLTEPVLAETLGCEQEELRSMVLRPLVKEAVAEMGRRIVLTRHRAIAEAAVEILSGEITDLDDYYERLALAAIRVFKSGGTHPQIRQWHFDLADHFQKSRPSLAIRIAKTISEADSDNEYLLANLSKIYRAAGRPDLARRHCWDFVRKDRGGYRRGLRGLWFEWGTAAGEEGAHGLSAWLTTLSLSDIERTVPVGVYQATLGLAGLGLAFARLEKVCHSAERQVFVRAQGAAAQLGLMVSDVEEETKAYLLRHQREANAKGVQKMSVDMAFKAIKSAAGKAAESAEDEEAGWLEERYGSPFEYSFNQVREVLGGRTH